jgi:hypothetical protein
MPSQDGPLNSVRVRQDGERQIPLGNEFGLLGELSSYHLRRGYSAATCPVPTGRTNGLEDIQESFHFGTTSMNVSFPMSHSTM